MQINVIYDQSQGSLPAAFVTAVNYVVNYFDRTFANPVTVTIDLGYGEIAGQSLGSGALGESETYFNSVDYSQAVNALKANQPSVTQQAAYSTLPRSSPVSGGALWVSTAEEKALGLLAGNNSAIDGYVGVSSTYPFSYAAGVAPASGQYYFDGVLEHEFSEVLGRTSLLGDGLGGTNSYAIMDLFRYSAPRARQLGTGGSAYFSINSGSTNLDTWNTNPNGDLGDWAASAGADAFLAFSPSGQIDPITSTDLTLMNVLGWNAPPLGEIANSPFEGNPGWIVVGVGDFNHDGKSDLVYYNASIGMTQIQFLNGTTNIGGGVIANSPFEGNPGWTIVGVGDFNGDGSSDLVYSDASIGMTQIQLLNGNTNIGGGVIANSPFENNRSWTVVGVGDFNGDGKCDLVYYNANTGVTQIQLLNGNTNIGSGVIANSPFENNPGWTVVGVGDFNGGGKSDLVYYDASIGVTQIQLLNGNTNIGGGVIANSPFENNPSWTIVGVGDFNRDGKSDLVYYGASIGVTEIQFLNGNTNIGGGVIANSAFEGNLAWTVVGVGDFAGDGRTDIAYYNASTGVTELQFLNGNVATGYQAISSAAAATGLGSAARDGAAQTQQFVQAMSSFAPDGASAAPIEQSPPDWGNPTPTMAANWLQHG